jgi:Flp pilus assembly protein TadB
MMLMVMVIAGALAGGGLVLMARGTLGSTPPLATIVAELHRPREGVELSTRRKDLVRSLAGRPSHGRAADLAICERTLDKYVQDRFVWALLGAAPGLALAILAAGGVVTAVPPAVLFVGLVAGAAGGWLYARVDLRSDAEKARREFRHALAAYLELVAILMAGGAGVETAMFDAVDTGRGAAFRHLRSALSAAQARREPPWQFLGDLGHHLGIIELEELGSSMTLAGGGAVVRDSLVAKAGAIRNRDLAEQEYEAQSRSETMVLPVALMFAGFLILIGYPALSALSTP